MVATVPVVLAVAFASQAHSAPSQPGVTTPVPGQSQPGITAPAPAPAVPPAVQAAPQRQYLPGLAPSQEIQRAPGRSYEDYQQGRQQAPSAVSPAVYASPRPVAPTPATPQVGPAPTPVAPPTVQRTVIAPIDVTPGKLLAGDRLYDNPAPNIITPDIERQLNDTQAGIQAEGATVLTNAGLFDAPQADRVTAGAIGGGLAGAAGGALLCGVPAAVAGGLGGGAIGFAAGLAAAGPAVVVVPPPLNFVFVPGAAAAAGAAGGAALLGIPAAVGCGVIGGLGGAVFGSTAVGGERVVIDEPAPAPVPPRDVVSEVVSQVEGAVTDAVAGAPAVFDEVREVAADIPGGAEFVDAVESAAVENAPAVEAFVDQNRPAVETVIERNQPLIDQATTWLNSTVAGLPA